MRCSAKNLLDLDSEQELRMGLIEFLRGEGRPIVPSPGDQALHMHQRLTTPR